MNFQVIQIYISGVWYFVYIVPISNNRIDHRLSSQIKSKKQSKFSNIQCFHFTTVNILSNFQPPIIIDSNRLSVSDPLNDHENDDNNAGNNGVLDWPDSSGSLHAIYKKAAVASDHGLCSEIGR